MRVPPPDRGMGAAAGSRPGSTSGSQRRKHLTTVGSQNAVLPTDCREQSTRGAKRSPTHCCRRHEWEGGNFRAVNWGSSCSGHLHSIRKRRGPSHSKCVASHTPTTMAHTTMFCLGYFAFSPWVHFSRGTLTPRLVK